MIKIAYLNRIIGPYISEAGKVSFIGVAVFGLLAAVAEAFYPGFVINWISPKSIIQLGILTGVLALWPTGSDVRSRPSWLNIILGVFFTVAAFIAAWYYFEPITDSRFSLSLATSVTVGLSFFLLVYGDYSNKKR